MINKLRKFLQEKDYLTETLEHGGILDSLEEMGSEEVPFALFNIENGLLCYPDVTYDIEPKKDYVYTRFADMGVFHNGELIPELGMVNSEYVNFNINSNVVLIFQEDNDLDDLEDHLVEFYELILKTPIITEKTTEEKSVLLTTKGLFKF